MILSYKVVDILGTKIRLGIDEPTEISIFRGETYDKIQKKNKRLAETTDKTEDKD